MSKNAEIVAAAKALRDRLPLGRLVLEHEMSEAYLTVTDYEDDDLIISLNNTYMSDDWKYDHQQERDEILPDILAAANLVPDLLDIIENLEDILSNWYTGAPHASTSNAMDSR